MIAGRLEGPGPTNLITDVAGLRVGNAQDEKLKSGVTVLTSDAPFTAGVHIMGGAPGTRETDLLAPDKTVQMVDALVLSGGSAFGLDAASGVMDGLHAEGRGLPVGPARVPIVPAAILFDLVNGGDKTWRNNPYAALGRDAFDDTAGTFDIGTEGAGAGALTADLKGGLGSASTLLSTGHIVGALVAVNALGRTTMGDRRHFWAAPYEMQDEFGGLGPGPFDPLSDIPVKRPGEQMATTIAIVATDATLTQAQATRLAVAAHDGMARAIYPSHTPLDGDLVFAAATGERPTEPQEHLLLGHAAATTLARAIARAVFAATPAAHDLKPTWHDRFG